MKLSNQFWRGALFMACFRSLTEDIMGETAVRNQKWIESSITVPLAIGMLLFIIVSWFLEKKSDEMTARVKALKMWHDIFKKVDDE